MARAIDPTHIGYFASSELVQGLGWEQYPYPVTLDPLWGNSDTMPLESYPARQLAPPVSPSKPTLLDKAGFRSLRRSCAGRRHWTCHVANRNFPIPARIEAAYAVLSELAAEPLGNQEKPVR